jgi:hypothetical protein
MLPIYAFVRLSAQIGQVTTGVVTVCSRIFMLHVVISVFTICMTFSRENELPFQAVRYNIFD